MIPPSSGQVIYRGQSVDDLSRAQRRTYLREIQPIFQDPFESYNPFYKVDHVLTVPAQKFQLTESKQETNRLIEESLDMVGLQPAETLGRFPHQLSGGQRQRVMVARAMLLRPRLIVADEPVSMVDASLRATILESIRSMKQELGISVVYITHDLTTAYQIADNILVMYKGSVVEAGSVEQVIRDPKHPYTQLLVSSIPQPDPSIPWGAEAEIAGDPESMEVADTGCKFVDRCPVAFEPLPRPAPAPLPRTPIPRGRMLPLQRRASVGRRESGRGLRTAAHPAISQRLRGAGHGLNELRIRLSSADENLYVGDEGSER